MFSQLGAFHAHSMRSLHNLLAIYGYDEYSKATWDHSSDRISICILGQRIFNALETGQPANTDKTVTDNLTFRQFCVANGTVQLAAHQVTRTRILLIQTTHSTFYRNSLSGWFNSN